MPDVEVRVGARFWAPNKDELAEAIQRELAKSRAVELEHARGIKDLRRKVQLSTPAGTRVSVLDNVTPAAGYKWVVRLLGVYLAAAGTGQAFVTSDTTSTLSALTQAGPVASLTTSAAYQVATFPAGACILNVDEGLYLNFTQNINGYLVAGWEVPSEMIYKLY